MPDEAKRGANGGNARAAKLTPGERSKIAKAAAAKRWAREGKEETIDALKKADTEWLNNQIDILPKVTTTITPNIGKGTVINLEHPKHCPACAMGQILEKGEGTHVLLTVEHPVDPGPAVEGKGTEADVSVTAAPAPPAKPTKRQSKPMPKEFKTASSYAEKRLPQAIKEKSDHVGAVARLDAEINDLVRVIKALGGTVDPQAGQQNYPNPSYRPPYQPNPFDSERDGPSIDPALYSANRGQVPAITSSIPPPELIPGVITGGTEELGYDPRAY
jgi:hypothetical protein